MNGEALSLADFFSKCFRNTGQKTFFFFITTVKSIFNACSLEQVAIITVYSFEKCKTISTISDGHCIMLRQDSFIILLHSKAIRVAAN